MITLWYVHKGLEYSTLGVTRHFSKLMQDSSEPHHLSDIEGNKCKNVKVINYSSRDSCISLSAVVSFHI
jgi:hypothetical protein